MKPNHALLALMAAALCSGCLTTREKTGPAGATPAAPQLLSNGDFETGMHDWAALISSGRSGGMTQRYLPGLADPQPARVKADDAPQGTYVMAFQAAGDHRFILQHRDYELPPGRYILRAMVQAPTPVEFNTLHAMGKTAATGAWHNFQMEFDVPADKPFVGLAITGAGPGLFRFDDIRLAPLDHAAAPAPPARIGLEPAGAPRISLQSNQPRAMTLRLFADRALAGECQYRVENAWGEEIAHGRIAARLDAGALFETTIPMDLPATGHYRVQAQFMHGSQPLSMPAELLLAVLPDRALPTDTSTGFDSHFGCNMAGGAFFVQVAQMIGIRWVMCAPPTFTKWFAVEPRPGEWHFHDDWVALCTRAGLHLLGNLADPPTWATQPGATAYGGPWPNKELPTDWADWRNYVATITRHHYPTIRAWALWNEPNHGNCLAVAPGRTWPELYMELLSNTVPVVRSVSPDIILVAGTVTHPAALEPLIQAQAHLQADVLAHHWAAWSPKGYTRQTVEERGMLGDDDTGREQPNSIPWLIAAMRERGRAVPIWDTECHMTEAEIEREFLTQPNVPAWLKSRRPRFMMTRMDAANAVVRNTIAEWAAGIDKTFYWLLGAPGKTARDWGVRGTHTMLEWDRSPTAALAAYAAMTSIMEGAEFIRHEKRIETQWLDRPEIRIFHFRKDGRLIRVVWSNSDTPRELLLPVKGAAQVLDIFGVKCPNATTQLGMELKDEVKLEVGRAPFYVIADE